MLGISPTGERALEGCPLGNMEEFTLSELGVFLGVVGGIMTSVLPTIQKSKCKNIKCCGCECDRDPTLPSDDGVESTQP